jgi:hypothetical protein
MENRSFFFFGLLIEFACFFVDYFLVLMSWLVGSFFCCISVIPNLISFEFERLFLTLF